MTYLGKIGELSLKGSNKQEFENLLVKNTRKYLEGKKVSVKLIAGRLYIECDDEDCQAVEFALSHLLGITGWAQAKTCANDIEEIKKLRSIIPYLRSAEPINKVIWKVYYEKSYTDLIGRVIGQGIHTGIYKITNIENQKCYIG